MAVNLTNRIKGMFAKDRGKGQFLPKSLVRKGFLTRVGKFLLQFRLGWHRLRRRRGIPGTPGKSAKRMRVLLIEDDSAMARSIESMLRSKGS